MEIVKIVSENKRTKHKAEFIKGRDRPQILEGWVQSRVGCAEVIVNENGVLKTKHCVKI